MKLLRVMLLPFLYVCTLNAYAQDSGNTFAPARTLDELTVLPSPEAASMTRHVDESMDMTTGRGTLTVPIAEFKTGTYNIPIALTHRIGGFTIEELPGWVGLGWNLTCTGVVTRNIMGQPDEKLPYESRPESKIINSKDGLDYLKNLIDLKIDASLDRYSYSFPGGNGNFVIINGTIHQLPQTDNEITLIGNTVDGVRDFRITTPDGTAYEFTEREHSEYRYIPYKYNEIFKSPDYTAVSAWQLSRIITPEGCDTITYKYINMPRWQRNHNRSVKTIGVRDNSYRTEWTGDGGLTATYSNNSTTFDDSKIILQIASRTGTVDFGHETREITTTGAAMPQMYINSITIKNSEGKSIKTAKLTGWVSNIRRQLNELTIFSGNKQTEQWSFIYNQDINIHQSGGDIFNYPNGSKGDKDPGGHTVIDLDNATFSKKRSYNFQYASAGAIKQTVSPTGVITDYEYEPNEIELVKPSPRRVRIGSGFIPDSIVPGISIPINPDTIIWPKDSIKPTDPETHEPRKISIGIRIKSIKATDWVTGRQRIRTYDYSDGMCNVDFNKVYLSDFVAISGHRNIKLQTILIVEKMYTTMATLLQSSRRPGYPINNASIYYGKVSESISGTDLEHPILTTYEYDTGHCQLSFFSGGRNIPYTDMTLIEDNRYIYCHAYPTYGNISVNKKILEAGTVRGYFQERTGLVPLPVVRTDYEYRDGEYKPWRQERMYHSYGDSVTIATGTYTEQIVRDLTNNLNVTSHDFQSTEDFSYFQTTATTFRTQCDSTIVTRYFSDGSSRRRTTHYSYSDREHRKDTVIHDLKQESNLNDFTIYYPEDIVNDRTSAKKLLTKTVVTEGAHRLEHKVSLATNSVSPIYRNRGLHTLPLDEIWVVDGRDTLVKKWDYREFHKLTRASLIKLGRDSIHPAECQEIADYTIYGKPIYVKQTGRPVIQYEWGYNGELPTCITKGTADGVTLRQRFTHEPMTGCTSIESPSGRMQYFTYDGGRLCEVLNHQREWTQRYEYEMYGDTQGTYSGINRFISHTRTCNNGNAAESFKIYDGFGDEVATVMKEFGAGEDVATFTRYDALHRPTSRWRPLPTADYNSLLPIRNNHLIANQSQNTYSDYAGADISSYSHSSDNMSISVTAAGTDMAGHPATSERTCSSSKDKERRVLRYKLDGNILTTSGYYTDGELDGIKATDADGRVTYTFTDCMGREVLRRSLTDTGNFADTYTICNSWGDPLMVLPPEASSRLNHITGRWNTDSNETINEYAFIYHYDRNLRLKSGKLPGCSPTEYTYDCDGRLAFVRDGNLYGSGNRLFTLHDPLGRVAVTGICADSGDIDIWNNATVLPAMTATYTPSATDGVDDTGYRVTPEVSALLPDARMLTANYYDSYPTATHTGIEQTIPTGITASIPTGLLTATVTAILDGNDNGRIAKLIYYDEEERPAVTVEQLPYAGKVTRKYTYGLTDTPIGIDTEMEMPDRQAMAYRSETHRDAFGRQLYRKLITDSGEVTLGATEYNNIGMAASVSSGRTLRRTMNHDIRGKLTSWHAIGIGQRMLYTSGANPSYSGRIATKITEHPELTDRYDYSYDAMGRLTSAKFQRILTDGITDTNTDFSTAYSYDMHGNITSLQRRGMTTPFGHCGTVDDITMTYRGNHLISLMDNAGEVLLEGSMDVAPVDIGADGFGYDDNGNMTRDMSRGVEHTVYNLLNLPQRIEMAEGGTIEYSYLANGTKLCETVTDASGDTVVCRRYAGEWEITDGQSAKLLLDEGYMDSDGSLHLYVHDYQGNIVAVVNDADSRMEQLTDYYPYGMPMASAKGADVNRRKFGAKELTTESGLNLADFHARRYCLNGLFTSPDPMAGNYASISPYLYCAADPINLTDPSGMVLHLPQENKEYNEIWATFCKEARAASPLFNTLYTLLENSPTVFNVRFEPITTSDGTPRAGRFVPADDGDGGNIVFNITEYLTSSTVFEECFHAFQNENKHHGIPAGINLEFEAKIFVAAAQYKTTLPYTKFETNEILDTFIEMIYPEDYSSENIQINLYDYYTPQFIYEYGRYANKYSLNNIVNNIGNIEYRKPTYGVPLNLQTLLFIHIFNQ